jgi:hypothetical protein
MKIQPVFALLIFWAFILSACSPSTPQPTQTPLPSPTRTITVTATRTASPTASPTPSPTVTATHTPKPTSTPRPSATPQSAALPMPEGIPLTEWEGLPIMTGAIAGQDNINSYMFTIKGNPKKVQAYYEKALKKLGWNLFAVGEGDTNNLLLIFQNEKGTMSIAIIKSETDDELLKVMLVK